MRKMQARKNLTIWVKNFCGESNLSQHSGIKHIIESKRKKRAAHSSSHYLPNSKTNSSDEISTTNLRRLVRILIAEGHAQTKYTPFPRCIRRPKNRRCPYKDIVLIHRCRTCTLCVKTVHYIWCLVQQVESTRRAPREHPSAFLADHS